MAVPNVSQNGNLHISGGKMISAEFNNVQKVEKTEARSKNVNFFVAPERVPFPALVNGDINTEDFLAAGEDYINFFYCFGFLFKAVISEAQGHIKILREFYEANKEERKTIGNFLACAKRIRDHRTSSTVLWFRRGLEFYYTFLKAMHDNICLPPNQQQETSVIALSSYEKTLKKHHSFIITQGLKLSMRLVPYRATVVKQLNNNVDAEELELLTDAMAHIRHLPQVIQTIDAMFARLQLDTTARA